MPTQGRVCYVVMKTVEFQDGSKVSQDMSVFVHPEAAQLEVQAADMVVESMAGHALYDKGESRLTGLDVSNFMSSGLGIHSVSHFIKRILVKEGPLHVVDTVGH